MSVILFLFPATLVIGLVGAALYDDRYGIYDGDDGK